MPLTVNRIIIPFFLSVGVLFASCAGQTINEKRELAHIHLKKGKELREHGKMKEAIEEQIKATELDPSNEELFIILSGMYQEQRDWTNAISSAKRAIKIAPNNPECHYTLAWAFNESGDYKSAVESFQEAVRLAPQNTNYLMNLGGAYEEFGNLKRSREYYEKALEIDPNYVPAIYLLGLLEADEGETVKAIKLLKQAVDTKIPAERMAEQGGSQRDAKKRLEELESQRKP